jgi:hypothetical protein
MEFNDLNRLKSEGEGGRGLLNIYMSKVAQEELGGGGRGERRRGGRV